MARPPTGAVVERRGKNGLTSYGLRFRALGKRQYITVHVSSRAEAEHELANVLADVRRGIWQPPTQAAESPPEIPTFHEFSSEWLETRKPELTERTYEDYKWSLTHHLLPFFENHQLTEITVREVDRYKTAKLAEGSIVGEHAEQDVDPAFTDPRGRRRVRADLGEPGSGKAATGEGHEAAATVGRARATDDASRSSGGKQGRGKEAASRRSRSTTSRDPRGGGATDR